VGGKRWKDILFLHSSKPILKWATCAFFLTFIALAMAELGSAAPTSGGLYYWTFKYSSPKWRNLLSWIVGCELRPAGHTRLLLTNIYRITRCKHDGLPCGCCIGRLGMRSANNGSSKHWIGLKICTYNTTNFVGLQLPSHISF
jgi:hypothetical protein